MNVVEYIKTDISEGLTLQQAKSLAAMHPKLELIIGGDPEIFMLMSTLNKVEHDIQVIEGNRLPLVKCPITNRVGIYDQEHFDKNLESPNTIGDVLSCVELFHTTFKHTVGDKLRLLTPEEINKRVMFIEEELQELKDAKDITDQFDALLDILYFLLGTFVIAGYKGELVEKGFLEVQDSNMTKLGLDGKPIFNEVGKIMKGANYRKPELKAIINDFLDKTN